VKYDCISKIERINRINKLNNLTLKIEINSSWPTFG